MQKGLNIMDLAKEIQRVSEAKKDFIAPTTKLEMILVGDPNHDDDPREPNIQVEGNGRVVELERIGGKIIDLTPSEFKVLAT